MNSNLVLQECKQLIYHLVPKHVFTKYTNDYQDWLCTWILHHGSCMDKTDPPCVFDCALAEQLLLVFPKLKPYMSKKVQSQVFLFKLIRKIIKLLCFDNNFKKKYMFVFSIYGFCTESYIAKILCEQVLHQGLMFYWKEI